MLKKLGEKHDFPDGFAQTIDVALRERNRLAHQFFSDYSEAMGFTQGRRRMIEYLSLMMDTFFKADSATSKLLEFQRTTLGLTDQLIERLMDQMISDHLCRHPNG